MTKNYSDIANRYARDVISGTIPACKWVRLACQRHLDDLSKSEDEDYPYRFDPEKAARICSFVSRLPHVKGRWAASRQRMKLEPWQVFLLACLFGWIRRDDGFRRFREAYICIPRKNGKSPLAAGIGLYMFSADGEYGAEVYCGATTEAQAWEVFRPAKQMVERLPEMANALGIQVNAKSLVIPANGSRFLPVIGKPGDGASVSCGICDEFHEADTADLYDTLKTGMVGRDQPLLLVITTAGFNTASPCRSLQEEAQKVLERAVQDDQLFALVYTIDDEDDWSTLDALKKANPNFGVSVNEKALVHDQQTALQTASKANTFKTKHLNIWCNASVAWMNMAAWHKASDPKLTPEQLKGNDCFIGLDLGHKLDLCAVVKLFRKSIDGKTHYYCFPRFYLPKDRAQAPECQHYQKWVHEGFLSTTTGAELDFRKVVDDVAHDASAFSVLEIDSDPYALIGLKQLVEEKSSVPFVAIDQRTQFLSEPAKELEAAVLSGRFHHDGNPIMTWCVSNVVARTTLHDNIVIDKEKSENKIDGVDAVLNAIYRSLVTAVKPSTAAPQFFLW